MLTRAAVTGMDGGVSERGLIGRTRPSIPQVGQPEVPMSRPAFSAPLAFVLPLVALAACGTPSADDDTAAGGDTADTAAGDTAAAADDTAADTADTGADTADTGPSGALTVLATGAPLDTTRYATAHLTGTVTAAGLSIAVDYAENTDEEPADCTATLSWTGLPATDAHPDSDWTWQVQSTVVSQTGSCTWPVPPFSGGLDGDASVYVGWYTDYTDDWGDTYTELLSLGYTAPGVVGASPLYSTGSGRDRTAYYTPGTGALDFDASPMGQGEPRYWTECTQGIDPQTSSKLYTSDAPSTGILRCDADDVGDVYTLHLDAGDRLGLSADYASDGSDLALEVAGPDGCLLASGGGDALGSDGSTSVPSVDFRATDAGTYTVTVHSTYCTEADDTLEYSLAASVR